MKNIATIAATLTLVVSTSFAVDRPKGPRSPEEVFKELDTNHDGKLSPAEYKANKGNVAYGDREFKNLDKNNDGFLTLEEFSAKHEKGEGKKK
jgi:hypothetical protein